MLHRASISGGGEIRNPAAVMRSYPGWMSSLDLPGSASSAAGGDDVRASDAERESVVRRLNTATGEGRLTLSEFSDRVDRAYAARTRAELVPLLADLPAVAAFDTPASVGGAGPAPVAQTTPVGAIKRSGRWRLDRDLQLRTVVGSIKVDLRGAEIAAPEVVLHLATRCGSVKVWVPDRVRVVVDGHSTIGSRQVEQESAAGDGPLVRLRIDTTVGSVKVFRA